MGSFDNSITKLLNGAIDLHVHTGPSFFNRLVDDFEMAELALEAGMKGFTIKAHEGSSVCRAYLANKYIAGKINIYGGHVMNIHSGGINPYVVDSQIKLGAKIVWFPTISSENHINHYGSMQYGAMKTKQEFSDIQKGLSVIDEQGKLLSQVEEVLELIAQAGIIMATGHLSNQEVILLCNRALEHGVEKIIITHPDFETNRMTISEQKKLAAKGAYIEKTMLCLLPSWNGIEPEEMAKGINCIGAERCILTTDFGQVNNPNPVEGFKIFIKTLLDSGVDEKDITQMVAANPANLVS